jgi:hypothetical protein
MTVRCLFLLFQAVLHWKFRICCKEKLIAKGLLLQQPDDNNPAAALDAAA